MASWKRYTASELASLKTIESRSYLLGRKRRWRDVKKVGTHRGVPIRWSLMRPTRQVLVELQESGSWVAVEPVSIGTVIEPTERAALAAHERGDYLVALLLIHAVLEATLRANQKWACRAQDGFVGLVHAYERWTGGLPRKPRDRTRATRPADEDVRKIVAQLRALNDTRNEALHVRLWRDGLDATNRWIGPNKYERWSATLGRLWHMGNLAGHLRL